MNRLHRWYCRSARWRRTVDRALLPWVLGSLDVTGTILEIGPGPGITTDALLRRGVGTLTALEVDPLLAAALDRRLDGQVSVQRGDATAMPFPDGTFDVVTSFTMLHHVPSRAAQDRLLAESRRVLRPGGTLVGSDSRTGVLFRLAHLADTMVLVDPGTFTDRLVDAGFTDVRVDVAPRAFRFRAVAP